MPYGVAAVRQGLMEAGYVEGRNVAFEYRGAEDHYERLPALAAAGAITHQTAGRTNWFVAKSL
jgi:hypothetical protein